MGYEKEKEIIGYLTDDKDIYCVDCILKNQEMMKTKIEKAINVDDTEPQFRKYLMKLIRIVKILMKLLNPFVGSHFSL